MLCPLLPLLLLSLTPSCWAFLPAPDSCCSYVEVRGGDFTVEGFYELDTYNGDQVLLKEDFWGITVITYKNGRWVLEQMKDFGGRTYSSEPTEEECPENVAFGVVEVSCSEPEPALPWWAILIICLAAVTVLVIALVTWCCCYYDRKDRRERRARGQQGGVVHSAPAHYPGQSGPAQYPGQIAPAQYPGQSAPAQYPGQIAPAQYLGQIAPAQYPAQVVVEGGRGWEPAPHYNTQKF